MTRRKDRQLIKEKKQRERFEQIKRNEYSKEYLKEKNKINEIPHSYPKAKLILIRDFLKSKDLYKSIGLFIGSQLSIFLLLMGVDYPSYAPIIGVMSIIIGLICVILSIREINRRQSVDPSRKPIDFKLVFKIVFVALFVTTIVPIIISKLGLSSGGAGIQPNQKIVDDTLTLFPISMMFTTVIVAPVIEETIFRELLPFATGPSYLSFIFTSFLFIMVHTPSGVIGWLSYGIITFGFLFARLKNNNVYSSIAVHFIWNALSLIL